MRIKSLNAAIAAILLGALALTAVAAEPQAATPAATDRSQYGDLAEFELRDRAVTAQDVEILERARELLVDDTHWNRQDERECADDETANRRSLFCALHAASVEILGSYDHRRVALQEVRFAIMEVAPDQEFEHRLMDFNNLPSTSLNDVHEVLRIAKQRVTTRLGEAGSSSK